MHDRELPREAAASDGGRESRDVNVSGRVAVGHPVDVASGSVFTVAHDFDLPGTMPLLWRRHYATDSAAHTSLGPRWTTGFLMTLQVIESGWELSADNGSAIRFDKPQQPLEAGGRVVNLRSNMELLRHQDGYTIVHWHHGEADLEIWRFRGFHGSLPLVSIENAAGHQFLLNYDTFGRLARVTQVVENREITFHYTEHNQLALIRLEHAKGPTTLVRYTYDRQGMLASATDAAGAVMRYTYDSERRMTSEQNPLGSAFHFQYDKQGRCVVAVGDGGQAYRKLMFHSGGRATDVTDSHGSVRKYLLNAAGQVLQEISPMGAVATKEYDALGRLVKQINADGTARSFEYDDEGNRVGMTFEDGSTVQMGYNNRHALTSYTDALGNTTLLERDERNQLIGVVNPLGNRFATPRDGRGFVIEEVSPLGRRTLHAYGPALSWVEMRDSIGVRCRFEYDVFGNRVAYHDAEGLREMATFDLCNRPIEARDVLGHVWSWRYNAMGEVTEYTSGAGVSERGEYDSFGQLIAHHNAVGVMRLKYDLEGRPTEVINRKGEHYRCQYDADGRVIREVFFDGRVEEYEWNTRNQMVRAVNSNGDEVSYKYNPVGELAGFMSPRGLKHSYEYDARGLLIAADAPGSRLELSLDEAGRIVAEKQNDLTVATSYDADNFCVSREVLGSEILFSYDVRGRLSTISDLDGPVQEIRWNVLNQPIERSTPAGIVEQMTWRRDRMVLSQSVKAGGRVRAERRYEYDQFGRVLSLTDLNRRFTYSYDAIGRLLQVNGPNGYVESYTYDPIGAITRTHRGEREVGPNGRILRDEQKRFVYDAAGMLESTSDASGQEERFSFDANGQLRQATRVDGSNVDYVYDALGRRVERRTSEHTTKYAYAGPVLVGETDTLAGDRQFAGIEWYTLAEWKGGERLFVVPDETSTVREVLSSSGGVTWRGSFEAYGHLRSEEGQAADRQRFPGQFSDRETGLVYNIHRDYHPILAAYVVPDPVGLAGGADHYGYPRNPFLWFDPFGLKCGAHDAEANMGAYMNKKGYKKISERGKDLNTPGIDGVYMAKDGKGPPLYIICEAKSSQSGRLGSPASGQQMSDAWINTGKNGAPPPNDRLTQAVGATQAQQIRNAAAADPTSVSKAVYHQPGGEGPSTVTPLQGPGSKPYDGSGTTDKF